ncbi:hypothetical protein [Phaeobacter italicus]|uniref:hypothetical protein n=1 Tax=Phaeobacter italicus TaxID=481446 RepID=UPI001CD49552|nr:hypothetical protein [Phaeobacter italicus]MCA0856168.1 hypothetical protein [Phaeobacter italicus]
MTLYIRMFLYLAAGVLAGQGLAIFDAEAGTVTFKIDSLAQALTGLATFIGTFAASRIAKRRGGAT